MPARERGKAIESRLAKSEYSSANGWYQVGAEPESLLLFAAGYYD